MGGRERSESVLGNRRLGLGNRESQMTDEAGLKSLILLQDKYISILISEMSDMIEEGLVRSWTSQRTLEISNLRNEIADARKMLSGKRKHYRKKRRL
jgi:hypothetical protein